MYLLATIVLSYGYGSFFLKGNFLLMENPWLTGDVIQGGTYLVPAMSYFGHFF